MLMIHNKSRRYLFVITVSLLFLISLVFSNITQVMAAKGINISTCKITAVKDVAYDWKAATQSPVIKDGSKTLKDGTDYSLSYQNNSNLGRATLIITGMGKYTGTVNKTFNIVPPKVQLTSVESNKGGKVNITWKYFIEGSGYEIYYSTTSKGKYKKLTTINSSTTYTYEAALTANKTYYIKVRAYYNDGYDNLYGAFSKPTKITAAVKEKIVETKVTISGSDKSYGPYILISDLPDELVKNMKYMYPNGAVTALNVQYLNLETNEGRNVDFFQAFSEDNNLTMGKNECVGMFSYTVITSDECSVVDDYFEAMKPDNHGTSFYGTASRIYNRAGGTGAYVVSERENPALSQPRVEQGFVDLKEDGYKTIISGLCEWIPN